MVARGIVYSSLTPGGTKLKIKQFREFASLESEIQKEVIFDKAVQLLRTKFRSSNPSLLIVSSPKSASTFLKVLIARSSLGLRTGEFVPEHGDREQVLSEFHIFRNEVIGRRVVAHQHARATSHLLELSEKSNIRICVLARNLPDTIVSLRDHLNKEGSHGFIFKISDADWRSMTEAAQFTFLSKYALPWYIDFFASWIDVAKAGRNDVAFLTYRQVTSNRLGSLAESLTKLGFVDVRAEALERTSRSLLSDPKEIRYNRGLVGRGSEVFVRHRNLKVELDALLAARPKPQQEALRKLVFSEVWSLGPHDIT